MKTKYVGGVDGWAGTIATPSQPTGLTATGGNSQVVLSWTGGSNTTSFGILRSLVSGGPYYSVGSTTTTNFTDTNVNNGTQYYYVVQSANYFALGANSNEASATPISQPLPLQRGAVLWYSIQRETGLTNNASVTTIHDQSGNSKHATATTAGVYKASGINGKPSVTFNGTSTNYSIPSINLSSYNAVTVYMVVKGDGTTSEALMYQFGNGAGGSDGFFIERSNANARPEIFGNGNIGFSGSPSIVPLGNGNTILSAIYDKSQGYGNETLTFTNGLAADWNYYKSDNTNNFGNNTGTLGSSGSGFYYGGDIAELIVIPSADTDIQRQAMEAFLNADYAGYTVQPAKASQYADNAYNRTFVSTNSRLIYSGVTANSCTIYGYTNLNNVGYTSLSQIEIKVNGSNYATVNQTSDGFFSITHALPVGSASTVEFWAAGPSMSSAPQMNAIVITGVTFSDSSGTLTLPTPAKKLYIVGDSIATGYGATTPVTDGWQVLMRIYYGSSNSVITDSWGYRALHDDCSNANDQAYLVSRVAANAPNDIWINLGTNDYGLNAWSASSFGTAYGSFLDALHTALPSANIYAQTPLVRSTETANTFSNTLGDYRTAISNLATGRTWLHVVDGSAILTTSDLSDGTHPSTSGYAKYATAVKTTLGL